MEWFDLCGFITVILLMIPTILDGIFHRETFENRFHNRFIEILEQIGRFGCLVFAVFHFPVVCHVYRLGWAKTAMMAVNGGLLILYYLFWLLLRKKASVVKAWALSGIPTVMFLLDSLLLGDVPLLVISVLFGIGHVTLSVKNAAEARRTEQRGIAVECKR